MDEPTVVEIVDSRITGDGVRLFTTLEGQNPSGSIKDRMVRAELSELLADGRLREGDRVSDVSAGSTARSLAHHCRELGLACDLFVPDVLPESFTAPLEELGATVHRGSREEGYALYDQFCATENPHRFEQLSDHSLLRHYHSLGAAVNERVGPIDTVIGAVGTGHTVLGVAEAIEPRPFVVSAEPAEPNVVLGIRNVELERFGPMDACKPEMFDLRLVLDADARKDFGAVLTDQGEMRVGESFALVLSATERLLEEREPARIFLVGAENRI
ncbi:MAG TPA: pyridoxal-phosphate dependent enzyme [Gaiellaceae bacterium]|nr:pyridoxal-phosphate dependent enzyme [Gaiellaceae bacterium]